MNACSLNNLGSEMSHSLACYTTYAEVMGIFALHNVFDPYTDKSIQDDLWGSGHCNESRKCLQ